MKIIAIDIESTKVIPFVIEVLADGTMNEISTGVKSIGIIKRQTKGKFSASSVSFKLEAIMQCYDKCEVEFVSKVSLNAFYKKNDFQLTIQHKYQTDAARLAQYLG
jgi:hypothetical protein